MMANRLMFGACLLLSTSVFATITTHYVVECGANDAQTWDFEIHSYSHSAPGGPAGESLDLTLNGGKVIELNPNSVKSVGLETGALRYNLIDTNDKRFYSHEGS